MKQKYLDLLNETLAKIKEIDKETEWQEHEPEWWLSMVSLQMSMNHELLRFSKQILTNNKK